MRLPIIWWDAVTITNITHPYLMMVLNMYTFLHFRKSKIAQHDRGEKQCDQPWQQGIHSQLSSKKWVLSPYKNVDHTYSHLQYHNRDIEVGLWRVGPGYTTRQGANHHDHHIQHSGYHFRQFMQSDKLLCGKWECYIGKELLHYSSYWDVSLSMSIALFVTEIILHPWY
jgi:hypothetical protein